MNAPYYIKVFEYSKSEMKYKHERDFFPGTINLKYIANIVAVEMEKSIWPNDASGFGRYIDIASFKNLGKDKVKGEDKYPKYILTIDDKEYDMEMLKDKTDYYNMILANKYNEYCLEGLE